MKILVTGAKGFVGKNLVTALRNIEGGNDLREKYQQLLPLGRRLPAGRPKGSGPSDGRS